MTAESSENQALLKLIARNRIRSIALGSDVNPEGEACLVCNVYLNANEGRPIVFLMNNKSTLTAELERVLRIHAARQPAVATSHAEG